MGLQQTNTWTCDACGKTETLSTTIGFDYDFTMKKKDVLLPKEAWGVRRNFFPEDNIDFFVLLCPECLARWGLE